MLALCRLLPRCPVGGASVVAEALTSDPAGAALVCWFAATPASGACVASLRVRCRLFDRELDDCGASVAVGFASAVGMCEELSAEAEAGAGADAFGTYLRTRSGAA